MIYNPTTGKRDLEDPNKHKIFCSCGAYTTVFHNFTKYERVSNSTHKKICALCKYEYEENHYFKPDQGYCYFCKGLNA